MEINIEKMQKFDELQEIFLEKMKKFCDKDKEK